MLLKRLLQETLDEPHSEESLNEYLEFIDTHRLKEKTNDSDQEHHILPRSLFEKHKDCEWNLAILNYNDHVHAHYLLFLAYPISEFGRCFNFMKLKDDNELNNYHEKLSIARKKSWKKFKKTHKYSIWRKKKSENTSKLMSGGLAS